MLTTTRLLRFPLMLRRSLGRMLEHDSLNLAQSAAYSAIVALFPALIVIAAMIALLPDVAPLKIEVGEFFNEVLPADVFPLLTSYFVSPGGAGGGHPHTARALVVAAIVSVIGASSTIATLMEGLHRAAGLPMGCWTFWQKRARSLLLVPLSLIPLGVASVLVVFGRLMTEWLAEYLAVGVRPMFYGVTLAIRWTISLTGVVALTALIYRMGVPAVRGGWARTVPGAVVATAMWFVATLSFGWYVTRVANYSAVYGSLGAGIALLFWLYLVFWSVLFGAEFNEQFSRG